MKLFEPIKINNIEIKNRIIMPAMDTNQCLEGGYISEETIKYYEERAKGGVGLIIVEAAYFDKRGRGTEHMISIEKNDSIPGLKRLTEAIKKHGTKALIQIYHAGAQSTAFLTGLEIVAPSAIATKLTGVIPKELSKKDIKKIIKGYAEACQRVKKAGFDGVEIHAGHGYLINQFFSPLSNKRQDEYGGSFENRIRFALEVLQAVREKCGSNFIIDYRLNCNDFIKSGLELDEMVKIAKKLEENGVDLINITAGIFDSPYYPIVPYMNRPRGLYSEYSAKIKSSMTKTLISVVGRINTPEIAEQILLEKRADLVTIGRGLIADPYFAKKINEGKREEINQCIGCNACLNQILIEEKVACAINPNILETDANIPKTKQKRRVLIVGAGPAGLEAAKICKLQGHDILVIEKEDKIGGALNLACFAPSKSEINNLIKNYAHTMEKLGIDIKLNTSFSRKIVDQFKPDAIILAIGTKPSIADIKGLNENNYIYFIDVLKGQIPKGEKIVILGGGMIGIEVAETLTNRGKQVVILEESKTIGSDLYALVGSEIVPRIYENPKISVEVDAIIDKIIEKKIIGKAHGKPFTIAYDEIVNALQPVPNNELDNELKKLTQKLFKIGDCKKPRKILDAIKEGYELGLTIESTEGFRFDDDLTTETNLQAKVLRKIKDGTFSIENIPDYLSVMVDICNKNEKIQKKSKKLQLEFQFSIESGPNYWIKIKNGKFSSGESLLEKPDVTITIQKAIAVGIFTGEVNAVSAYMRKQVKFGGSMMHGLKFQQWTNVVSTELGLGE